MQAGFLGVGNMGLPMAGKLLDGGHHLTVFDIRGAAMQPLLERQAQKSCIAERPRRSVRDRFCLAAHSGRVPRGMAFRPDAA